MPNSRPTRPRRGSPPKAFDVFKPGKALASPTSRPVITGHKPKVQDSTLTDKPGKSSVSNARTGRKLLDSRKKVTVPSPSESATPEPVSQPAAPDVPTTTPPAIELASPEPAEAIPQTPAEAEPSLPPSSAAEPEAVTVQDRKLSVQSGESSLPAAEFEASAADAEASDRTQSYTGPLTDPAQIVVSRHKSDFRFGAKTLLVALLLLIVAAAAVDAVLDDGLWSPNYNIPHTHLLKR